MMMKNIPNHNAWLLKVTICLLFVWAMAAPASAQFAMGIKATGNASNYKNLSSMDFGFGGGLFLRLGEQFFFQPEVEYSFKSTKLTNLSDFVAEIQENTRLKQHSIDVPVLLGFHFINNDNFKVHLTVGPRFGFRIGSNIKDIDPELDEGGKLQWAGQFGIGFDFWRFTLSARYDLASDKLLNRDHASSANSNNNWTQNMIVVSLGFKFVK